MGRARKGTGVARNHGYTRRATPYPNEPQSSDIAQYSYATHYKAYLTMLAYQLFEWKNLPKSIDPRYLEMVLHTSGYAGFFYDKEMGFIVSRGTEGQGLDHYMNPTVFTANEATYHKQVDILRYDDDDDQNKAIMIYNNDLKLPTLPSLYMFADELADIRQISRVNRNAQKTPYMIQTTEKTYFSVLNVMAQIDDNNGMIFPDKDLNVEETVKVLNTLAPYVVDKLRIEQNSVWNELMTFLGINNANLDKQARTQSAEVYANVEQVDSSGNMMLKNRQLFCERANRVFEDKLEAPIEVELRHSVVREFQMNQQKSNKDTSGGQGNAT